MKREKKFLSVNYNYDVNVVTSHFKDMNLGENNVCRYIFEVRERLDITGEETRASFSGHGLRAMATTNRI